MKDLKEVCAKSRVNFNAIMRPQEKVKAVSKAIHVFKSFKKLSSVQSYADIADQSVQQLMVRIINRGDHPTK